LRHLGKSKKNFLLLSFWCVSHKGGAGAAKKTNREGGEQKTKHNKKAPGNAPKGKKKKSRPPAPTWMWGKKKNRCGGARAPRGRQSKKFSGRKPTAIRAGKKKQERQRGLGCFGTERKKTNKKQKKKEKKKKKKKKKKTQKKQKKKKKNKKNQKRTKNKNRKKGKTNWIKGKKKASTTKKTPVGSLLGTRRTRGKKKGKKKKRKWPGLESASLGHSLAIGTSNLVGARPRGVLPASQLSRKSDNEKKTKKQGRLGDGVSVKG